MPPVLRALVRFILVGLACMSLLHCSSTGTVAGNDGGSAPINDQESIEYQKAVTRCLKTGGTRVVKVMGELRCY